MDRMKEFKSLLTTLNIVQPRFEVDPSELEVMYSKVREIELLVKNSRTTSNVARCEILSIKTRLDNKIAHTDDLHVRNGSKILLGLVLKLQIIVERESSNNTTTLSDYEPEQFEAQELSHVHEQVQTIEKFKLQSADLRHQKKVSQEINELGNIFSEISLQILVQGEALQRIDYAVEESLMNTARGTYNMGKLWAKISSRRKTILRVFMIFFILMFMIYIYKYLTRF